MSKIRESARGEECHVRLPHICNHNPETVVWAHANGSAAGKGIGMKSPDVLGAYACFECHREIDRQTRRMDKNEVRLAFWEGHARSVLRLLEKGLIK